MYLASAQTDRWADGQKVITIAHPEHSSYEQIKKVRKLPAAILHGTLRINDKIISTFFTKSSAILKKTRNLSQGHRYPTQGPFSPINKHSAKKLSWKRAITPIIIGRFYPKSNLTYILWLYTCVQNLKLIYYSLWKILKGKHFRTYRRDIWTDVLTAVILNAPPTLKMAGA